MFGFVVIKLVTDSSMYTLAVMGKPLVLRLLTSVWLFLNVKCSSLA